jgi:hypothetical protein
MRLTPQTMHPATRARLRALIPDPMNPGLGDPVQVSALSDNTRKMWTRAGWLAQIGVGEEATYCLTREGVEALS